MSLKDLLARDPRTITPLVARMASQGATHADIARALGIHTQEFWACCDEIEGFVDALKLGEDYADDRVEQALYKRAVGYDVDTEKVINTKEGIKRVPTTDHLPPDIGAAKFWLVNRRADRWADKQQVDVGDYGAALREAERKAGVRDDK